MEDNIAPIAYYAQSMVALFIDASSHCFADSAFIISQKTSLIQSADAISTHFTYAMLMKMFLLAILTVTFAASCGTIMTLMTP